MKIKLVDFVLILILSLTISSVNQWSTIPIGSTYIWWGIYISIILIFIVTKRYYFNRLDNKYIEVVKYYLLWNIICIIRGVFVAENYWEWKNLIAMGLVLLLPFSLNVMTNKYLLQKFISSWLRYALPLFFVFFTTFKFGDAIGRYLVPISFLLLFFSALTFKWRLLSLVFVTFVFVEDLDARSNIIKFSFALLFGLLYYLKNVIPLKSLEYVRLFLLIVPVVLFVLGISGIFNVFNIENYIKQDISTDIFEDGQRKNVNLKADTRTALYTEVLSSSVKYKYVILGRTPARGNESSIFGQYALEELKTGKMERYSNEVSILNIFTWTGLIGVILYFLVFYHASYLAINRSNNFYIKSLGAYLAFRWSYAWVEDFSSFDLSYLFLWIMLGMCFSKNFRDMDDKEIVYWIKGILNKHCKIVRVNTYVISKRL